MEMKRKKRRVNNMENLWEMIAKSRGLELGEEFLYSRNNSKYKYRISERGLEYYNEITYRWFYSNCSIEFIRGDGVIEKLPFRPKRTEVYYTIIHNTATVSYHWGDTPADYERLIAGIVFRTREEAEAYIPTWHEIISKL